MIVVCTVSTTTAAITSSITSGSGSDSVELGQRPRRRIRRVTSIRLRTRPASAATPRPRNCTGSSTETSEGQCIGFRHRNGDLERAARDD